MTFLMPIFGDVLYVRCVRVEHRYVREYEKPEFYNINIRNKHLLALRSNPFTDLSGG